MCNQTDPLIPNLNQHWFLHNQYDSSPHQLWVKVRRSLLLYAFIYCRVCVRMNESYQSLSRAI